MKKTMIALLGAVMLASAAYAIGAQSGGGNADAASRSLTRPAQFRAHFQRALGLGDLASKLGVSEAQLQQALMDVGQDLKQDHADDFAQALADALGMPVDKVKAALDKQHAALPGGPPPPGGPPLPAPPPPGGHPAFGAGPLAGSLAQALGVDEAKVRDALQKLAPEMKDVFATRLAALLGVDKAKVEAALSSARPLRAPRIKGFMRVRPMDLSSLAKDLGVTEDQLKQALMKAHQAQETKRRDAFAEALAKRLNIDPQKVKDALGSMPGPHFFGHP